MELTQPGIKQLHIVIDLGHGAYGRSGGAYGIFTVDGNRGWDTLNTFHQGAVHALHELACVWRKGFNIPALPLGVKGIKGQRRFPGAAYPGDHGYAVKGNFKVKALKVVLPCALDFDSPVMGSF